MDGLGWIVIGAIFSFTILYYIVKSAVEDGTLNALIKYDELKKQENKVE